MGKGEPLLRGTHTMFSMSLDACFQQTQACFPFEACLENQGVSFCQCWLLQYFKTAKTQNNKILKILVLAKHEQNNTNIYKEDKELRKTMDLVLVIIFKLYSHLGFTLIFNSNIPVVSKLYNSPSK